MEKFEGRGCVGGLVGGGATICIEVTKFGEFRRINRIFPYDCNVWTSIRLTPTFITAM